MGFSLKGLVKGIYDDVNVFDGGKSHGNPSPQPARPQPATTAQADPTVRPNQSFGNKIVDQFSANTPSDNYRRYNSPQAGFERSQDSIFKQNLQGIRSKVVSGQLTPGQGQGAALSAAPSATFDYNKIFQPTNVPAALGQKVINVTGNRVAAPISQGIARSVAGTGEGLSGLYDLATPGTGNNRFGKIARKAGEATDRTVKDNNYNKVLYKGAQAATDVGTFLLPGAIANKVGEIPKVAAITSKVGNVVSKAPAVAKVTTKLATLSKEGNVAQRVGAKLASSYLTPGAVSNVAGGVLQSTGLRTNRGIDNNAKTLATDIATNLAFQGATNLAGQAVGGIAKPVINKLKDTNLIRPSNLNPNEVANLANFRQRAGGPGMDEATYQKGIQAAQKAGVDYQDPTAVDNLLGAHRTFDTRQAGRKESVRNVTTRLVPNNEIGAVGRNVLDDGTAKFDAQGKPLSKVSGDEVSKEVEANNLIEFIASPYSTPKDAKIAKAKLQELAGTSKTAAPKAKQNLADSLPPSVAPEQPRNFGNFKKIDTSKPTDNPVIGRFEPQMAQKGWSGLTMKTASDLQSLSSRLKNAGHKTGVTTKDFGGAHPLSEVIDNPALFDKYPQLKDTTVVFADFHTPKKRGMTVNGGKTIFINSKLYEKDPTKLNGTLVHEIQHLKQDYRGMKKHDPFNDPPMSYMDKYNSEPEIDARRKQQQYVDSQTAPKQNSVVPEPKQTPKAKTQTVQDFEKAWDSVGDVPKQPDVKIQDTPTSTRAYNKNLKEFAKEAKQPTPKLALPQAPQPKNPLADLPVKNSKPELTKADFQKIQANRHKTIDNPAKDGSTGFLTATESAQELGYKNFDGEKFQQYLTPQTKQPPKATKRIKQAENDYISGKISPGQLETIRNKEAARTAPKSPELKAPVVPEKGLDTKGYIKEQSALQEKAGKGSSLGSRLRSEFSVKALDALAPIEKPVEKAVGGRDANYQLRDKLDRSLRSDTIAGQYAKDNGLHDIITKTTDVKALDQYLIAKHAPELEVNGVKTGRNAAKDAALVKELGAKYEPQAKAVSAYSNKLLDKTVEYGLISKKTASYLKEKYPNYVPFDRIFSDAEMQGAKGSGSGPASLSTQTVVQRIKGSERQIHSPLESILSKTHDVVAQGERNLAARSIAETRTLPGNPLGLKELKRGQVIGNKSTISYIEDGIKRTFETTPEVAAAAKSLNKQQLGLIGKILSYPTRALRLGATGVNVGFTMANVVKDVASGAINSRHPVESLANPKVFLKALSAATNHGGKAYGELVREGAGGTSFDISRNAAKDTVGKIRAERNVVTKTLYTVRHPGELLRAVEDTIGRSEEFGRASQYYGNKEAALKQGKSLSAAKAYGADAARNNTVNFARAGEYGRVLNSVLPYFNAGIQGSRTLLRNARDRPVQTGAKIAITAFMPVAATTTWNLGSPERKQAYDDIPDYEKQGNIIIVPPNPKKDAKGRWNVIKIPVSQEVANLNNVVRNGVESLHKDKGFNFAELAGNLVGTATSLNVQSPRQAAGQIIPQGLKPGIETLTNQNLFTGNTIVPQSKQGLDKRDQYGDNTSATAKVVGRLTGISPYIFDNAARTATGGAGQNVLNAADRLLAATGQIKSNEVKGKTLGDSILNRFTSAQGSSEYAAIDKNIEQKSKQLKSSQEYKLMTPEDKAKALNRLKSDVISATKNEVDAKLNKGQFAPDYTGKQTKLSKRQAGLLDGKTDVNSYLKPASSTQDLPKGMNGYDVQTLEKFSGKTPDEKKQIFAKEKDAEYKLKLAEFEKDKHAGNLTDVATIRRTQEVARAKVGAEYDKQVRDLYSLNKSQIYDYIHASPNGQTLASQLIEYDNKLKDAGVSTTTKFTDKHGRVAIRPKEKGSGGRGSRGGKNNPRQSKYASLLSSTNRLASSNQTALRNLVTKQYISKGKQSLKVASVRVKKGTAKKSSVNYKRGTA